MPPGEKPFRIAMVFQGAALLASLTVAENVALRLREHHQVPPSEIAGRVREALEQVELSGAEGKLPGDLSGGMRKRAAIARALAIDPELILYDEPTADLDPLLTEQIGELIARIRRRRGSTQIVVTHNLGLARAIADRIAVLDGGRIVECTRAADLDRQPSPADARAAARGGSRRVFAMSNEQRIGVFFLVGLVLLAVAVELTIGLGLFRHRYVLYADFHDVQGLDRGADVRLAGLRAGRVEDLRIDGDHVRVTMALDGRYSVQRDAVAKLDFRALSGERFVALTLGTPTAPTARPGDVLEGETPAGFADAVDQLAHVAQSIDELATNLNADAGRLLTSLSDVVEENRSALNGLTTHVASITEKLDRGAGTLGRLVNDPKLYERVTDTVADVQQSVREIGAVARNLNEGQGTLGKLLARDDTLYRQAAGDDRQPLRGGAQRRGDHRRAARGRGYARQGARRQLALRPVARHAAHRESRRAVGRGPGPDLDPRHDRHEPVLAAHAHPCMVRPPDTLSTCPVT